VGIGWRPEIDLTVERLAGVDFVEVVAENIDPGRLPGSLRVLRGRGLPVLPHGVTLGLGGAAPPDPGRLAHLARCAEALGSPLVSEHVAFVRAGGLEAGHLLPVPRTRDALEVLVANVRLARAALPVPVVLENVAPLLGWPDDELTDGEFLAELVERTGAGLLLDVANLWTAQVNLGLSATAALDALPLDAVAYVHVAGGVLRDGVWHDTHTHPVPEPVFGLLAELRSRTALPGVLLERDGAYPSDAALAAELAAVRAVAEGPGPAAPPARPAPRAAACPDPVGARERLAGRQTALVRALVGPTLSHPGLPPGGFPEPAGVDAGRVAVQAAALVGKRRDLVARARPDLAERPDFAASFAAWARTSPPAGVRADTAAFAAHLDGDGRP
jgi:uncharacterized protein